MNQLENERLEQYLRVSIVVFVFALVLSLWPFAPDPANDIKILLIHWVSFLLATALLIGRLFDKRPIRCPAPLFGVLVLFLVLQLVAALCSGYVGHSLSEVRKWFSLFLLYLVAANVYRTPANVRGLMAAVCVATALSTAYAFFQHAGLDPFPWEDTNIEEYAELPGTFGNANFAAHTLILCIIMAVYLSMHRPLIWCAGLIPVFGMHLYMTNQRGGFVALAAGGMLLLLVRLLRRISRRSGAIIPAAFIGVGVLGAISVGGGMLFSFMDNGVPVALKRPLLLRCHAYGGAAEMIVKRPFLGYGPGNYVIENAPFWSAFEQENFARKRAMNDHVHNDALEAAVDAGLAGGALYVTLLVAAIWVGLHVYLTGPTREHRRLGAALATFFTAFLVDGLFGFNARVPVSGALLMLMAGALEGARPDCVGLEPSRLAEPGSEQGRAAMTQNMARGLYRARFRAACLGAVIVVAWVCLIFDTRVFVGRTLIQRGNGALHWGDYDAAGAFFARAQRIAPWDWLAPYKCGVAARRSGRLSEAIGYFTESLERNPNYVMTLVRLGQTSLNISQASEDAGEPAALARAADYARQALALCPVLPEGEELLGRVAFVRAAAAHKQGDRQAATAAWAGVENHFLDAIDYGAKNPEELYTLLASAYLAQDEAVDAERALIRAIKAKPGSEAALPLAYGYAVEFGRIPLMRRVLRSEIRRLQAAPAHDAAAIATLERWAAALDSADSSTTLPD